MLGNFKSLKKSIFETSTKTKTTVAFSTVRLHNRKPMASLIRMYYFNGNIQKVWGLEGTRNFVVFCGPLQEEGEEGENFNGQNPLS